MTAPPAVRYPATPPDVDQALRALGASADEVAATLLAGGYRGVREDCTACPVAEYLGAVVDGCEVANVSDERVRVYVGPGHVEVWPPPKPVVAFLHRFDTDGAYPALVRVDDGDDS